MKDAEVKQTIADHLTKMTHEELQYVALLTDIPDDIASLSTPDLIKRLIAFTAQLPQKRIPAMLWWTDLIVSTGV